MKLFIRLHKDELENLLKDCEKGETGGVNIETDEIILEYLPPTNPDEPSNDKTGSADAVA